VLVSGGKSNGIFVLKKPFSASFLTKNPDFMAFLGKNEHFLPKMAVSAKKPEF
jgi:hypothetical protein